MTESRAILVVDLAFGDCGKGTIIDFLTRAENARTVVRFNGGPQAGHNVVTPDGRHHTFSQFGSGTFVPGVRTILSRFMLIEPYALLNEANHLAQIGVRDALGRLIIDRRCPVITPAQQAANRLRELARARNAHGTCGLGIGETMQDGIDHPDLLIRAGDLRDAQTIRTKLRAIRELKLEELRPIIVSLRDDPKAQLAAETLLDPAWIDIAAENYLELARHAAIADEPILHRAMGDPGTILFEGAQGVLLDETFGFHPHTTWSNTTFANADTLLDEAGYRERRTRLGVLRSYFTRHGTGPFVAEDSSLCEGLPEPHNADDGWQGSFRVGVFDAVAARYAMAVCGHVDGIAITHLDRLRNLPPGVCTAYEDDVLALSCEPRPEDGFFVRTQGTITDIRPTRLATLETAAARTKAISICRPKFAPLQAAGEEAFVEQVAGMLGAPVSITSSGPTAKEKRMRTAID